MYHPPDLPDGTDNSDDEFVELENITGNPVLLFDPALPANTWRLHGGIGFSFPPAITFGGSNFLLVVNFNPTNVAKLASFRAHYGVPTNVPIFGPFSGKLNNAAESVRLSKPGLPQGSEVPYVLLEAVDYTDSAPWPAEADGSGAALQRRVAFRFGNDPANWVAALPAAGRAPASGPPPLIYVQPMDQVGFQTQTAIWSFAVTGSAPFSYQWRFNGANLSGATNHTLVLTNLQPAQAGVYSVVVFNAAGALTSSNALLTLRLPVYITMQPQSQNVRPGSNATFSVVAFGNGPLKYQWVANGTDLPRATNATLTISNVAAGSVGAYAVTISDSVSATTSTFAFLSLLIDPLIVQQPLSVSVPAGANATFSVLVTNTASLPLGFRWRRNGVTLSTNLVNQYASFYTASNVQADATYTVVVTNPSRPVGLISVPASLTIVADTDLDGIPDSWELANGFDPGDPVDANDDTDSDGMTNWQEYIAGTDPQDPQSRLKIEPTGDEGVFQFLAVSNRTYTIQSSDRLNAGSWIRLTDVVARTNSRLELIFDPNPGPNRYYRVVTPQQP